MNDKVDQLPQSSAEDFKKWVLNDGMKPSMALRRLMDKYDVPYIDSSIPIKLVELTYPDMDISRGNFTFKVIDSAYPNSKPEQFGDNDFDMAIKELMLLPPQEW